MTASFPPLSARMPVSPPGSGIGGRLQRLRFRWWAARQRAGPSSYSGGRGKVVGLGDVTVVEPISNVVLVVDENRHVATPLTLIGQLAKWRLGRQCGPMWPRPARSERHEQRQAGQRDLAHNRHRPATRNPSADQ